MDRNYKGTHRTVSLHLNQLGLQELVAWFSFPIVFKLPLTDVHKIVVIKWTADFSAWVTQIVVSFVKKEYNQITYEQLPWFPSQHIAVYTPVLDSRRSKYFKTPWMFYRGSTWVLSLSFDCCCEVFYFGTDNQVIYEFVHFNSSISFYFYFLFCFDYFFLFLFIIFLWQVTSTLLC